MNNRTKQNINWIPLTKGARLAVWFVAELMSISLAMLTMTVMTIMIVSITMSELQTIICLVSGVLVLPTIATAIAMKSFSKSAKKTLEMGKMAVVVLLTVKKVDPLTYRTYYTRSVSSPKPISEAREQVRRKTQASIAMILPLQDGELAEIYVEKINDHGMYQLNNNSIAFEAEVIGWELNGANTRVWMTDNELSVVTLSIDEALYFINKNRSRIETSTIGFLTNLREDHLQEAYEVIENQRAMLVQLLDAGVKTIEGLAQPEKFPRGYMPAVTIGTELARTITNVTAEVPQYDTNLCARVFAATTTMETWLKKKKGELQKI